MALLLALIVLALMAYLAITSPFRAVLLYGLTASYADGAGVGYWLSTGLSEFRSLAGAAFLLAGVVAFFQILRATRDRPSRLQRLAVIAAALAVLWTGVGAFVKGFGLIDAVSFLPYLGVTTLLAYFAQRDPRKRQRDLIAFVTFQVALATAILIFSGLRFLRLPATVFDQRGLNLSITDPGVNKYAVVQSAQFHNPNALGLYGVVAVGLGLVLLSGSRKSRFLAMLLIFSGSLLWLNSFTRGPIAALVGAVLLFVALSYRRQPMMVVAMSLGLPLLAALLAIPRVSALLFPDSRNVSVRLREEAWSNGVRALESHPWLGVPPEWIWQGTPPHVLPIAFAAQYGIFVGLCVTFLVFGLGAVAVWRGIRNMMLRGDSETLRWSLMVFPLWGIALTNNLAAPILFWAVLGSSLAIATERPALSSGRAETTAHRAP